MSIHACFILKTYFEDSTITLVILMWLLQHTRASLYLSWLLQQTRASLYLSWNMLVSMASPTLLQHCICLWLIQHYQSVIVFVYGFSNITRASLSLSMVSPTLPERHCICLWLLQHNQSIIAFVYGLSLQSVMYDANLTAHGMSHSERHGMLSF